MAPFYDIASGLPYSADERLPTNTLHATTELRKAAMAIGGERRFGHVERRHWERFAQEAGLAVDRLVQRVEQLSRLIPQAMRDVIEQERATMGNSRLFDRLLDPVEGLCTTTRRAL